MIAPELVRCATCGNLPTTRRPLTWDREAADPRTVHAWMPCDSSRDPDYPDKDTLYRDDGLPVCGHPACNDMWPCPAPPDGWGICARCREAGPITDEDRGPLEAVVSAVIETPDGDQTTTRYGSHELPVFVHVGPCPKDVRDRQARSMKRTTARRVDRDEDTHDSAPAEDSRVDLIPTDGDGMTLADIASAWDVTERTARRTVTRLVDDERLTFEEVATAAGGAPRKVYWRVDR